MDDFLNSSLSENYEDDEMSWGEEDTDSLVDEDDEGEDMETGGFDE